MKYQTMTNFLALTVVIAAIVSVALCLSKSTKLRDGTCGPDSVGNGNECCYPVICKDTMIEADFNYEAEAHIRVDKGDGQNCVPFGNVSKPTCTKDDLLFSNYIDWDYGNPGSCSPRQTTGLADVDVHWTGYPHIRKTYTVRVLYCNRNDVLGKACCSQFTSDIAVKP